MSRVDAASAIAELTVQGLTRTFGGVTAVDAVSFTARAGRITALIGPNGAGKSTTLKVVAGALTPTSGSVIFAGEEIGGQPAHTMASRGIIRTFQLAGEFPRLTVLENLLVAPQHRPGDSLWGAMLGRRHWRRSEAALIERALRLLERFQLVDLRDEYAGQLSGGQKRMVEIMRALMAEPRVLLLDEPLVGVSPTLRLSVERVLAELRGEGLTIVIVEHELASVERLSDSVVVMAEGRVLAHGTFAEMRANKEVVDAFLVA